MTGIAMTSNSPSEPKCDLASSTPIDFNITVTAIPSTLVIGSGQWSTITVRAVRVDNGQPPPNLTPITLETTLGTLGSAGGETQVMLQLINGSSQTMLFPGTSAGVATVRARLDRSEGFTHVHIADVRSAVE
jgi:hypothetical protein